MQRLTIKDHKQYAQQMLEKAKAHIRLLVMDQDGTVKGGNELQYQKANVSKLLQKIIRAGKYPAIISASGASALKSFAKMNDFYFQEKISTPTYIGIGNGTALYRFDKIGRTEIYNYGLKLDEIKTIIKLWKKIYQKLDIKESDLQPKGIKTFKEFAQADWTDYIPKEYVAFFKQFGGRCFTEQIKVTVVFPSWEAEKQRELVEKMQKALDQALGRRKYLVSRGDDTFLHITHAFGVDPKLYALRTIIKKLRLTPKQVVAIGDLPLDNDKRLLIESRLPYTFTNTYFEKTNLRTPPFILPGSSKSAVGSVYKAISYLLF
jgi:hydroxymethylpyrimidine pyrophosphatase-like HAD family hydrolase